MAKPKLTIVTGNSLKFRELSAKLGEFFECEQGKLEGYHEIQGTPEEILFHKLNASYEAFQQPVLVDDTSFEIGVLQGFPGPYMKDFSKALSIPKIGLSFTGSPAKVIALIGIMFSKEKYIIGRGEIEGIITIATLPRSEGDLDFDPIFKPNESAVSFAEMSVDEKNKISHRGKALDELLKKIPNLTK